MDEQHTEAEHVVEQAARGSDDAYCSAYPSDGHAYSSHSVDAAPIRWVMRCHLCGHISSAALRQQLAEPALTEAVARLNDQMPAAINGGLMRVWHLPKS